MKRTTSVDDGDASDDEDNDAALAGDIPRWSLWTKMQTLRNHAAVRLFVHFESLFERCFRPMFRLKMDFLEQELEAVRDIIVDGNAWVVYKLLKNVDELDYSCDHLKIVLRACSGYKGAFYL